MPRWEHPEKELPSFRLTDVDGKVWYLKRLQGKTLLVCIWATWSGPSQWILPKFQAIYDQLKDREDLEIFSMNVDEDTSLARPFAQKHGYTFPVIPAFTFVGQLVGFLSVPRMWIVDGTGKWVWEQVGFDANATDWEQDVLKKLGSSPVAG
jgi:thiol-disulfide isomerase/thioredoxin